MRTAFRRSVGRIAAPVMVAVVAAHLFLRSRTWTHEWMWAIYQFGFVTILLGPVLAGIAAWEGWRLSTSSDLLTTSLRPRRAAGMEWAATLAWGLLIYFTGLFVVTVLVRDGGTPGWPDPRELGAALPPIALLGAETGLGMLAGWWVRHALAAPAAALGCFLLSLWFYAAGPSQFITVGGATASLVGLAPRPGLEVAQVLCFVAMASTAVLLVARARPFSAAPVVPAGRIPVIASGVVLVAAATLLHSYGQDVLEPVDARLICVGTTPAVCVAPGYLSDAARARTILLPFLGRLKAAGVPVPPVFRQGATPGRLAAAPIDASFLLGDDTEVPFLILNAYVSKSCFDTAPSRLQDEWSDVITWLDPRATKASKADAGSPDPANPAELAVIRKDIADLTACGR